MSTYTYPKGKRVGKTRCESCGHEVNIEVSHYKNGTCGAFYNCAATDENGERCKGRNYFGPAKAQRIFAEYEAAKQKPAKEKQQVEEGADHGEDEDDFLCG